MECYYKCELKTHKFEEDQINLIESIEINPSPSTKRVLHTHLRLMIESGNSENIQ